MRARFTAGDKVRILRNIPFRNVLIVGAVGIITRRIVMPNQLQTQIYAVTLDDGLIADLTVYEDEIERIDRLT